VAGSLAIIDQIHGCYVEAPQTKSRLIVNDHRESGFVSLEVHVIESPPSCTTLVALKGVFPKAMYLPPNEWDSPDEGDLGPHHKLAIVPDVGPGLSGMISFRAAKSGCFDELLIVEYQRSRSAKLNPHKP
jgi:hypothetical protein